VLNGVIGHITGTDTLITITGSAETSIGGSGGTATVFRRLLAAALATAHYNLFPLTAEAGSEACQQVPVFMFGDNKITVTGDGTATLWVQVLEFE